MALNTFPKYARPGDTIAIGVGSPDNMSLESIDTVTFNYNGVAQEINLKPYVRGIFKLYADKASRIYQTGYPPVGLAANQIVNTSGHEQWSTIMVLDLPDIATEPALVPGLGQIKIRTLPGAVTYPTSGSDINDLQANGLRVDLEILSGTGSPNPFTYEFGTGSTRPLTGQDDLKYLEPMPGITVRPPFEPSSLSPYRTDLGATEVKLDLHSCNNQTSHLTDADIRVVPEDMTTQTASQRSVAFHVNDSDILNVIFISSVGKLSYFEPRFTVIFRNGLAAGCNPWFYTNNGTEQGVAHYDINGTLVTTNVPFPAINPQNPDNTTEYYLEVHQ